jgi:hypothetical protein
VYSF